MLDFPSSGLVVGQIFVAPNGVTYQWDGTLWKSVSMTGGAAVGDFTAVGSFAPSTTSINLVFPTVLCGNVSGAYNSSNGRWTPPPGRYRVSCGASIGSTAGAIV